jgi:hypothetical protein
MNRSVATLLASLLTIAITACGPTTNQPPLTNVTIWWEFDRNTFIDGRIGIIPYDTNVNWPPGTGSRACPESGVDFVIVFDNAGNQLSAATPCINQNVQGAVVVGFQAPSVYWIEGYRNGVSVPVYRGQVTIDGLAPPPAPAYSGTVIAAGIPDALTVDAILADANSGPQGYPNCGLAVIQRFEAALRDGFGSLIWRNSVPCAIGDVPGVSFGPVDRDDILLWMNAVDILAAQPIVWSICGFGTPGGFPHFQGRENRFSLRLPQGMCTTPPFP